jgi:hypothetical protein
LASLQPVKQEIKARPEPVDVPSCNTHFELFLVTSTPRLTSMA